jgi:hypothetical protein
MRNQLLMLIASAGLVVYATAEVAGTPGPAGAAAGTPRAIPEVNVIAKRLKLDVKVLNFIYGISALENEEGLARWKAPVCPLVSGLPRQQGEFVLARISEIARAAAVPLAGKDCRPNLFIFVTTQPKELLQAMENRYFPVTFGNASPSQADAFINAPRPVRVWHGSYETPARIGPSGPPVFVTSSEPPRLQHCMDIWLGLRRRRRDAVTRRIAGAIRGLRGNGEPRGDQAQPPPGRCPDHPQAVRWRPSGRTSRHERLGPGVPEIALRDRP